MRRSLSCLISAIIIIKSHNEAIILSISSAYYYCIDFSLDYNHLSDDAVPLLIEVIPTFKNLEKLSWVNYKLAYCKTVGAIHQDKHCHVLSTTSYPTKVSTLTSTVTVVRQHEESQEGCLPVNDARTFEQSVFSEGHTTKSLKTP
jgi:hypothetical protein